MMMNKIFSFILLMVITSCAPQGLVEEQLQDEALSSLSNTSFVILDSDSNSQFYSNSTTVTIKIKNDDEVQKWCLSESQTTAPGSTCSGGEGSSSGWHTTSPTSFTLSNSDGIKTVYLWLQFTGGIVLDKTIKEQIILDTTGPSLTLNTPPNIITTNVFPYSLSGFCSGYNLVKINIEGSNYFTTCDSGMWSYTTNVIGLNDGTVTFSVEQLDEAGNATTKTATVTKDASSPIITITSPAQNGFVNSLNQAAYTFSGSCTEDGTINITGDITDTIACTSGSFSKSIDLSSFSEGALTFYFDQTDGSNNEAIQKTINVTKDITIPTTAFSTPSANSYANVANVSSFYITGTCTENGGTINLSGAITDTAFCGSGNFTKLIDLSAVAEGTFTINVDLDDAAGNPATQISRSFNKDTVAPNLTQTTYTEASFANTDSVTFGGDCEDGVSIVVSGTDSNTATCTSGTWSYTTSNQTTDATYSYTFTQTDTAGNSTTVNSSWKRDITNPTVDSVVIADGATNVGTSFVIVKAVASDIHGVTHMRLANSHVFTDDCQSEYADDNWQTYSGGIESYSHQILAGDGIKKVCVWAKDAAGNVNVMAPTAGTLGVNMDTVSYEVGNPPIITAFSVTNNVAGGNFGTTTFASGDQVKIDWTVTDIEELADSPINLYYTTSSDASATWTEIVTEYGAIGTGQTTYTDSYTTFNAPTAGYFRIKIVAKDSADNTSIAAESDALNSGNWSIYAGTTDRGVGGSAKGVSLLQTSLDPGFGNALVDKRNNNAYIIDTGYGIYKMDALTGKVDLFMAHGSVINFSSGDTITKASTVPTSVISMYLDGNGLMYLVIPPGTYYGAAIIWQLNLDTLEIKEYIGGGAIFDATSTPTTAMVQNAPIAFDEDNSLYYFTHCQGNTTFSVASNSALRLMKVTQNSTTKMPDAFSIVAGDCTRATPTSGASALATSIGTVTIPTLGSLSVWENGNKILYNLYAQGAKKIINGTIYASNLSGYGNNYIHELGKLYMTNGRLYEATLDESGDSGDVLVEIAGPDGTGACLDDNIAPLSSCSYIVHPPFLGPNNTLGFMQGAVNSQYFMRYIDSGNTLQTYVGSRPFYGEGLKKEFMRSNIAGIHYKKAADPNQAAFSEGLYFMDQKAMVMGKVDTSNDVSIVMGNQSGATRAPAGTTIGKDMSLGATYAPGSGVCLKFDDQGLPWTRMSHQVYKVNADLTLSTKTGNTGHGEQLPDGDSPTTNSFYVYGCYNNMTLQGQSPIYFGSYVHPANPASLSSKMILLDTVGDTSIHIMGDISQSPAVSADDTTGGNLNTKTFPSICNSNSSCFIHYEDFKDGDDSNDRIYYS